MAKRNLVLIGYRGSGKTRVGREVARKLGWRLVDTDELIEAAAGRCIRDIFAHDGQEHFRALETRIIEQVVGAGRQVIAVGGGAVLSAGNRSRLRQAGICIWLTAPAAELYRRLKADPRSGKTRPALSRRGGLAEVRHLLAQRRPLYAELADHVVPTRTRSIEDVATAVLRAVAGDGVQPDET
jgi:shikimate kinase